MISAELSFALKAVGSLAAASAVAGATTAALIHPRSRVFGPIHARRGASSGSPLSSEYALTFDDGPTEPWTADILDVLAELDARATFFVVGRNARKFPRLVERMHAQGHIVANHSYDHPYLGMFGGPDYWEDQIRRTDDAVEAIIGVRPALFRPPLGVKTWFICGTARRSRHAVITWTRRGMDGVKTSPEAILARLVPRTRSGEIVVLHDGLEPGNRRRDPAITSAALPRLIRRLRDRGLEPATLDRLLRIPAYAKQ